MITLYKKHSSGNVGTWSIWNEGKTIIMETKLTPGSVGTRRKEVVTHGKAGRSLEEQIQSRINSRTSNKMDGGYKHTEAEAASGTEPTNVLKLYQPMLAAREIKYLADADQIFVQPKLDGMRLLVTKRDGKVIAYTRRGKIVNTVPHIVEKADFILEEGEILDGELYHHGTSLQTIMSWSKRSQENTANLNYHVFDMISDKPFAERLGVLHYRLGATGTIKLVKTALLTPRQTIPGLLHIYRGAGYEGLILRNGSAGYEVGKRSKGLIKVKEWMDDEYLVRDVTTGAQGMTVLVCETPEGKMFRVTAPGNHAEKKWALENPEVFIGNYVTIQYAGLTPYGIPFHPVCLGLR